MALISFARGMPGPDLLPIAAFGDCAREALERDGATALQYGPPGGYPPLKQWVAEQHGVDPARVMVTNGSLQGFAFTARHFVQSGSRFFVEAPCYDRSLSILRKLGAEVEQVELADDGLDVDAIAGSLREGDVVYTIPTFQNPSGRTLSLENRRRLLDLAADRGATVFEDDPYGMLRFEGDSIPRLFELSEGSTIFLSSFSKTVAPGIRTGYLILPEELVPAIEELVLSNYVSPAIFVEAALLEFLTSGRFEPNLETVRDGLADPPRRDARGPHARDARRHPLESARGRLLPLARPAERGGGRHASRPRRRGGRRLHQGRRLLLPRRRGGSGAARVLLRHRTRDRRGHHPPRAARARSGCRCGLTAAP